MKITLSGSLGHISRVLATTLIEKGHDITIISSKAERQKEIEALGAKPAIGKMEDAEFLCTAFAGADLVYVMETLGERFFSQQDLDYLEAISDIGRNYQYAIRQTGVKKVVHLSSIGAHTAEGNGILSFHYNVEKILAELPDDVAIKTMRPVGFYYNMYAFIPTIKSRGMIIQNYGGAEKEPWVAPVDIAKIIAEEMDQAFNGRTVRYIASDEVSPDEVAKILGEAIGNPQLKWETVSDEQMLNGMIAAGMNPAIAKGMIEMNAGRRNGVLYEDYNRNRPELSQTKMQDFAKDFAKVYNESIK